MVGKRPIGNYPLFFRATVFLFFLFCSFFFFPTVLHAASFLISPASGTYTKGQTFSVSVYASSADAALNAVSAALSFSKNTLQVVSITKAGSLVNVWVTEPSYSNAAGTANFEGVILNPGYQGTGARLVTVTFRVLATGSGTVNFSSGTILANDGNGTALPVSFGSGRYSFIETAAPPTKPETPPPTQEKPTVLGRPVVVSPTHPDPLKWYPNNTPTFEWGMEGATGVSFMVDQNATTEPDTASEGVVGTYTAPRLADGLWYFHVKVQNTAGWSETAHYSFQVDNSDPISLEIYELEEPRPGYASFIFNAFDEMSGVIGYKVSIDHEIEETIADENLYVYTTRRFDDLGTEIHVITVSAYDAAGNSYTSSRQFQVTAEPVPASSPNPFITFVETYAWVILGAALAIIILLVILFILMIARTAHDVGAARRRKHLLKNATSLPPKDRHDPNSR